MKKSLLLIILFGIFTSMKFSNERQDFGSSYIALSVNDINESFKFYSSLGFNAKPNGGSLDQKWIIMTDGNTKIGLFQGMFPKNTIAFNPTDARSIYRHISDEGIEIGFQANVDKKDGPCSFMIQDPDGNPILIDQLQ